MSDPVNQGPIIQGWCPGALRPMQSGDGLVVRVRAPLGRLSQTQAAQIADLAQTYGNGLLDVSNRGNLQIRGVTEVSHAPLIDGLRMLNMIDQDVARETRRNIVLTPFWRHGDVSHRIATDLMLALAAEDAPATPGKFGYAIDCGSEPVLQDTPADIRIERTPHGLIVRADGSTKGLPVTADTAAEAALTLARWFLDTGGVKDGRGRMARHLAKPEVQLPDSHNALMQPNQVTFAPGRACQGFMVALEFGQMTADTLRTLAQTAAIRLTPWRMVLLEGAGGIPATEGLITDPFSPLLHVTACTGAPGCPQALSETRQTARALAPKTQELLHVSGCAKGCAHPTAAPVTLTATAPETFDLIVGGTAASHPTRTGLSTQTLLACPELLNERP